MAKYATTEQMLKCTKCEREFSYRSAVEESSKEFYDANVQNRTSFSKSIIVLLKCPSCHNTVGWNDG
jgi:hypothetical protein